MLSTLISTIDQGAAIRTLLHSLNSTCQVPVWAGLTWHLSSSTPSAGCLARVCISSDSVHSMCSSIPLPFWHSLITGRWSSPAGVLALPEKAGSTNCRGKVKGYQTSPGTISPVRLPGWKKQCTLRLVFNPDGGEETLQLILPARLKQKTLKQLHQPHGHQGIELLN